MIRFNAVYDKKWLIWCLIGILAMCGVMKASGGAGFLLIFPLILAAFSKNRPELMLYSLLMTTILTVTNDFFAPKGMTFSVAARAVYLAISTVLTLQLVGQRNSRLVTPLLSLLPYLAYMVIVSSVGWSPIISYLKLILFVVVFSAFYSASNAATARGGGSPERLRSVMLAFMCFIVFGSLAVIPFPGIGKMGAAQAVAMGLPVESIGLFKGVTIQPQALGPMIAAMATLLFADLLFSVRRWNRLYVALLLGIPVLLYYTSSRTAMGTFLAGFLFVSFLFMNTAERRLGATWKRKTLSCLVLVGMLMGITLLATPGVRDAAVRFIFKTGADEVLEEQQTFEQFSSSRQGLVDNALAAFRESPWIGNGFQVSREMAYRDVVSWKQLLSAPIEKGVWIYAVLEEGGVFGMLLFLIFVFASIGAMLTRQAYVGVSVFVVMLVANLGEFCIFSMSGIGGVMWALVFVGLTLDAQRLHQQRGVYGYGRSP